MSDLRHFGSLNMIYEQIEEGGKYTPTHLHITRHKVMWIKGDIALIRLISVIHKIDGKTTAQITCLDEKIDLYRVVDLSSFIKGRTLIGDLNDE